MMPILSFLQAQVDPAANPVIDMTGIGHTMVFLAILLGLAGIGFRVFVASRKRARTVQQQPNYAMPWQPPQPPPLYTQRNTGEDTCATGVFCPRCGVRNASSYCVTCGYDLQTIMRQVHEQFTGNRA
jgi:hypothetical protein